MKRTQLMAALDRAVDGHMSALFTVLAGSTDPAAGEHFANGIAMTIKSYAIAAAAIAVHATGDTA